VSFALAMQDEPIRIVGTDGRVAEGTLFLHAVAERSSRPETVGARLNDLAVSFLPVRRDGSIELVHLAWVAYVAVAGRPLDVANREEVGARRAEVELDLVGGETLKGDLLYELPAGHSRVSDLLNSPGERFLLLLAGAETLFVNRAAILRART
jgi:hypothetical protein